MAVSVGRVAQMALVCAAMVAMAESLRYSDLKGAPYTVTADARSLRLNDEPFLVLSGSIHYPRATPSMWPSIFGAAGRLGGLQLSAVRGLCCVRCPLLSTCIIARFKKKKTERKRVHAVTAWFCPR